MSYINHPARIVYVHKTLNDAIFRLGIGVYAQ